MKIFLSLILLICLSNIVFSQTIENEARKIEFNICSPEITEAGRQSSFHFNYDYLVKTDETGLVKDVKEFSDLKKYRSLMNDEGVIPCIRKWKLRPSERYLILISVGTTSDEKALSISSKTVKIRILL